MEPEVFRSVVNSAVNLGFENLDLTSPGGEFFTLGNAVALIETAKAAGFRHIGVFTNAIQLHKHDNERLLRSGINAILISFPGFDRQLYKAIYQVDKYEAFEESVRTLLETHKRMGSDVYIVFEPRTTLTLEEILGSPFYKEFLNQFIGERVTLRPPLRVFDTWAGAVKKEDLNKGMMLDIPPLKSIYPLKRPYPCTRLHTLCVCANGDVRLCNCRYDNTVETEERDGLYIGSLSQYDTLSHLVLTNRSRIVGIRRDFRNGRIPSICHKCSFYIPGDLGDDN